MALARLRRTTVVTEGKGNCAFNAFTLGFCNSKILAQLELAVRIASTTPDVRFKRFINASANALKIESNWTTLKNELLRLSAKDSVNLQHLIAPVMRDLSINLADKALNAPDYDYHFKRTEIFLLSAFNDCYRLTCGMPVTCNEEIFSRHSFIQRKFESVCRLDISENEMFEHIKTWWKTAGYELFLKKMRKPGKWAGDLELARLARYFGLVLDVVSDGYDIHPYTVYGSYGRFPYLHGEHGKNISEMDQLIIMSNLFERGILKDGLEYMNEDSIEFAMSELPLIFRRMDAVPHFTEVEIFVAEHWQNLKWQIVPRAWPASCVVELQQRNVIVAAEEKGQYRFAMSAEVAQKYISAIPCLNQIKNICRQYFEMRPRLVLVNHGGMHWENTLALPDPVLGEAIQSVGLFSREQWVAQRHAAMMAALVRRKSEEEIVRRLT